MDVLLGILAAVGMGYLIISLIADYWYVFLSIIGIIVLICVLYYVIKRKGKNKLKKKYHKEIDKYARIYVDLVRVTNNMGGYVFISYSRKFDLKEDDMAFSPHNYMLYFEVNLDYGAPGAVRDYYEGRYNWGMPYDEEIFKSTYLRNFECCNHIDKNKLWDSILDEILVNKCEKWDDRDNGEWYFHYPIVCPEEFKGEKREIFIEAIKERASQPKKDVKTISQSTVPTAVEKNQPETSLLKSSVKSHRLFNFKKRQAVFYDNLRDESGRIGETYSINCDDCYRGSITYNKNSKKWVINFEKFKPHYSMLINGKEVVYPHVLGDVTNIKIINTAADKVLLDYTLQIL